MALTRKQEKQISEQFKKTLEEVRFQGLKAGATGILGAVLEMCKKDEKAEDIVKEIEEFCESSLHMDGMKNK